MKKCTSCGFLVNNDEALFCPECGNKLGPVIEAVSEAPAADPVPVPEAPSIPETPAAPEVISKMPDMPPVPEAPTIPESPAVPEAPVIPDAPAVQETPSVPEAPTVFETPSASENTAAIGMAATPAMFSHADNSPSGIAPEVSQIAATHAEPIQAQPQPQPQFQPAPVQPAQQVINSPDNPIVEKIDRNIDCTGKVLGSPWFIIATFGLVLSAIAYIISAVNTFINPVKIDIEKYIQTINDYLYDFGVKISYEDYFDLPSSGGDIISLIVNIIMFLFLAVSCFGMIKLIIDKKKRPIPTVGFTLSKTNLVFRLVLVCIASAVMICLLGGAFVFLIHLIVDKNMSLSGFLAVTIGLSLIIIVEIIILTILYYAGMLKTITVAKKAGSTGKCPRNKVSVYAIVINIICTVGCISLLVSSICNVDDFGSIISIISYAGLALYFGGIAASMLTLKAYLTEIPEVK